MSERGKRFLKSCAIAPFTAFAGGVAGEWIGLIANGLNSGSSAPGPLIGGFIFGATVGLITPLYLGARKSEDDALARMPTPALGVIGGGILGLVTQEIYVSGGSSASPLYGLLIGGVLGGILGLGVYLQE